MDGVLSDATSRQHFLEYPRRDWDAFFAACGDDALIDEVARLLDVLDPTFQIVLLTARPLRVRPQTLAWLDRYKLRWDLLIMRDFGDYSALTRASSARPSPSCAATASTCASRSRTTAATSTCSTARASPACTSTRATTTDLTALASRCVPDGRNTTVRSARRRSGTLAVREQEHLQDLRPARRPRRPPHRHRCGAVGGGTGAIIGCGHRLRLRRLLLLEQRQARHPGRPGRAGHRAGDARVLRHRPRADAAGGHADAQALRHPRRCSPTPSPPAATPTTRPWPSPRASCASSTGTSCGACWPTRSATSATATSSSARWPPPSPSGITLVANMPAVRAPSSAAARRRRRRQPHRPAGHGHPRPASPPACCRWRSAAAASSRPTAPAPA